MTVEVSRLNSNFSTQLFWMRGTHLTFSLGAFAPAAPENSEPMTVLL